MRIKGTFFITVFLFLFLAMPLSAGTKGAIKISLRDEGGRVVNGTVTGKKGKTSKKCKTKSGTCKLKKLAPGKWTLTAKSTGGLESGSRKITVKAGKVGSASLRVKKVKKKKTQSGKQTGPIVAPIKADSKKVKVKDLSKGKTKSIAGTTRDDGGRVINGTVTVKKEGKTIGKAKTTAGTYKIYDLSPGSYSVEFVSTGGKKSSRTIKIVSGKVADINMRTK